MFQVESIQSLFRTYRGISYINVKFNNYYSCNSTYQVESIDQIVNFGISEVTFSHLIKTINVTILKRLYIRFINHYWSAFNAR